ncbi:MAG: response regulator transcription factor [Acidobacteriota bacterium]|nr:response regulator transcription factor [Acidobacteriota bacterium]MDQ5835474.1 response regulator transcription factor [Acidobacteriota bacterium]
MRVLIADDHAVVRRGLKQILLDEYGALEVGEAGDAHETLCLAREEPWDIVVLDISMPDRSGLEVLKELKQTRPRLPVLILTTHPEEQYAVRVLKAGAVGYMTKESAPEHLVEAVRKVTAGGRYITPTLADLLVTQITGAERPPHENLSDREFQVLRLIASGKTVGQIAEELSLSSNTVSTYRARVLEKMEMKTSAELTHYAISNGLV